MEKNVKQFLKRKQRTRSHIRKVAAGRLRLSVHRSGQHMYAQIIDDAKSITLASASTVDKEVVKLVGKATSNVAAAEIVGKTLAERAMKLNVSEVVFDRGGYLFHGRVKALAEAARSAGLKF